jgi:ankyrin repeat domain-containing protein 13
VRIDTTLIGFEATSWQRGNRSYLFKGSNDEAQFYEIDHDAKEYSVEVMRDLDVELFTNGIPPTKNSIKMRLQTPIISNSIDIEKISFERNKSGWFAWRNEKNENVNGYDTRVYNASNVEFITRTRTEHLTENQTRSRNSRTPLQHLLGLADDDPSPRNSPSPILETEADAGAGPGAASITVTDETPEKPAPTIEEYFSDCDLGGRDIGKPKKVATKVQRFKANLWLSDDFPIKLQEQILPILDLMSTLASPHVSKLKVGKFIINAIYSLT